MEGRSVALQTDSGVFAHRGVDAGTRFLLRRAPRPPAQGDLLDLGCGYGPIAVNLALRSPGARIWAVDVNERARNLTRENAAAAGVANVTVAAPEAVPAQLALAAIYSNPPVRAGLDVLRPLLLNWLARLGPGGAAWLVVHRHLGSDSLARWLAERGLDVDRLASHAGYRILRVQRRSVVEDDP